MDLTTMDLTTLILLVTNFVNLGFIFLIFLRGRPGACERFLAITLIGAFLWNFSQFSIQFWGEKLPMVVFYPYLSSTMIASSFLIFALLFPEGTFKKNKKLIFILYLINVFMIGLILIPGGLIKSYSFEGVNKLQKLTFGPLYSLFSIYIFIFFGTAFFVLVRKFRQIQGIVRAQLAYIIIGALITSASGVFINLILPIFGVISILWVGPSSVVLFFLFSVYAILRHHLFNMRVLSTEIFAGIIGFIFFLQILLARSWDEVLFRGILFLFVLLFGILLVKGALREVKRLQELSQAKSEFISIASHQLRTPLTAIRGYISMMLEGTYGKIPEKIQRPLKNVRASNERLLKLVSALLNISRIDAGRMEAEFQKASLEEIISSVVRELEIEAETKNIKLKCEKPPEPLPLILVDQDKIRQVILNIIDNAIRYTNRGYVSVTVFEKGGKIIIEVKDTGEGMSSEEMKNVFERFSRGKAGYKFWTEGTGLGLYVARKFVEMHNGRIWAESPGKGQGSTFYIELPCRGS